MSQVEVLFEALPALPSMPRVVQELIASLREDDPDLGSLSSTLEQDQTLTARVLRVANSGFYGVPRKISSVQEAISLIGLEAVRGIVIAAGVMGSIPDVPGLDMNAFWSHSMVTAGGCRWIARKVNRDAGVTYSAGLLHRVGEVLTFLAFPKKAIDLPKHDYDNSIAFVAVERQIFGFDHCEAGAELALRWMFPDDIQQAILHYVEPTKGGSIESALLNVTSCVALQLKREITEDEPLIFDADAAKLAGLSDDLIEKLFEYMQSMSVPS